MRTADWDEADRAFRKAMELMPESERKSYDVATSITALRLLEVQINRPNPQISSIMEVYQMATKNWPEEEIFCCLRRVCGGGKISAPGS